MSTTRRKPSVPQDVLKEMFSYNEQTGDFFWIKTPRSYLIGKKAGWINSDGYVIIKVGYIGYKAHHLAWMYYYGEWPWMTDHKDRNRANNAIENLRLCTESDNKSNSKMYSNNKTGVKGVRVFGNKFLAEVRKGGIHHHIGLYSSIEEAAKAVQAKQIELHGKFLGELR